VSGLFTASRLEYWARTSIEYLPALFPETVMLTNAEPEEGTEGLVVLKRTLRLGSDTYDTAAGQGQPSKFQPFWPVRARRRLCVEPTTMGPMTLGLEETVRYGMETRLSNVAP
jgi:hypothetical protein